MNLKIKIIGLFFLGLVTLYGYAQEARQSTMCSGSTTRVSVSSYFPNGVFVWQQQESGTWKNLVGSKEFLDFTTVSNVMKIVDLRCLLSLGGNVYDTQYFKIKVMPKPSISKIVVDQLCVGKISHFDYTTTTEVTNQRWTFNQSDSILNKTASWLIKTDGKIQVNLKVSNYAGCAAIKDTSFSVAPVPFVSIRREQLILAQYYYENVACGNDSSVFIFYNQGIQSTVLKWKILNQGVVVFERSPDGTLSKIDQKYIKRAALLADKLSIVWLKQQEAIEFQVVVEYATGAGCSYSTQIPIIILPFNSPEKGVIFQKPNDSKILLFKPTNKDNDTLLNYQWGYTVNGEDIHVGTNRFYNQFSQINTGEKYWVETYFKESNECRVRTYFVPSKSKVGSVQQSSMKIFPNPAKSFLTISLQGIDSGNLYLLDMTGNKIKTEVMNSNSETTWNLSKVHPGNYIVVFDDLNGSMLTEKLSITF